MNVQQLIDILSKLDPEMVINVIEPNGVLLPIPNEESTPLQVVDDYLIITSTDRNGFDRRPMFPDEEETIMTVHEYIIATPRDGATP